MMMNRSRWHRVDTTRGKEVRVETTTDQDDTLLVITD